MKAAILSLFLPTALALAPGDPAPNIPMKNQNGKLVRFSDFKGKYLLVYFYPKDETPGCTKEAEGMRDHYADLQSVGAAVVGISKQDEESHQKFINGHKLPFDLLVDKDGTIAKKLGVGFIPLLGLTKRKSLLFGPDGKFLQFYDDVDPSKHAEQVIADIKKYRQNGK